MDINIIGVPLYFGCDRGGVELGPNELRKAGLKSFLENGKNKVYDMGNIYVNDDIEKDPFKSGINAKYINEIVEVTENLANNVYSSLLTGAFPFIVGGDHALATGSLAGISRYFKDDLAVIWIDAHGDINTVETSPSGNVHGMPLAASMGIGHSLLVDLYQNKTKVKKENVFIIGARDLDKGELKLIDDLDLNVWTMERVKEIGIDAVCRELKDKLKAIGVSNVHISFDVDSIDPEHIKGTGTPVEDGMSLEDGKQLLGEIFNTRLVKSMDFVEFNPKLDDTEETLNSCVELLKEVGTLI